MASGVVDRSNLHEVLQLVRADCCTMLRQKLGFVNMMNPKHPDGHYTLDLASQEQRQLVSVLAALIQGEHACPSCQQELALPEEPPPPKPVLAGDIAQETLGAKPAKKKDKSKRSKRKKCVESVNLVSCVFPVETIQQSAAPGEPPEPL